MNIDYYQHINYQHMNMCHTNENVKLELNLTNEWTISMCNSATDL